MTLKETVENKLKIQLGEKTQIKLFASLQSQNIDQLSETIQGIFGLGAYNVTPETQKNITDDYYDTESLELYKDHALLRIRRDQGEPSIIAKSILSQSRGQFKRKEFEQKISEKTLQNEVATNFSAITKEAFPDLIGKRFLHMLKITNERRNFLL